MTAEHDGKSRRPAQLNLLASLPDERPGPGIDPAAFEELLTGMRDLREQLAGLRESDSAERPAPVTLEALEAWGDNLVARVAEAARTADMPGDNAACHAGWPPSPACILNHISRRLTAGSRSCSPAG